MRNLRMQNEQIQKMLSQEKSQNSTQSRSSRLDIDSSQSRFYHDIVCYNCDEKKHYVDHCSHFSRSNIQRRSSETRDLNLRDYKSSLITTNAALLDTSSYILDYRSTFSSLTYEIIISISTNEFNSRNELYISIFCVLSMTQKIRNTLKLTLENEYLVAIANIRNAVKRNI